MKVKHTHVFEKGDGTFFIYKEIEVGEEFKKMIVSKLDSQSGKNRYIEIDGKQVVSKNETFYLFDSLNHVDDFFATKDVFSNDVLFGCNPYNSKLLDYKSLLLDSLASNLNIERNPDVLEFAKKVESKINAMEDNYFFTRKHFLHLVVLVGEITLKKVSIHGNFKFSMKLSSDSLTYFPVILGKQKEIIYHSDLYEYIFLNNGIKDFLSYYIHD